MKPEQSELVKRLRMHEMRGVGPGVNEDCGEAADTIEAQAAEIARLRELISAIKRDADEWRVSRMTGRPSLENQKGERVWQTIRRASSSIAPIEPSTALNGGTND